MVAFPLPPLPGSPGSPDRRSRGNQGDARGGSLALQLKMSVRRAYLYLLRSTRSRENSLSQTRGLATSRPTVVATERRENIRHVIPNSSISQH